MYRGRTARWLNVVVSFNGRNSEDIPFLVLLEDALLPNNKTRHLTLRELERLVTYCRNTESVCREYVRLADMQYVGSVGKFNFYYNDKLHEGIVAMK